MHSLNASHSEGHFTNYKLETRTNSPFEI
jgi:hypothetical protein